MDSERREALAALTKRHAFVGHATHRATCDCNWIAPSIRSGNPVTIAWEHAAHLSDVLAEALAEWFAQERAEAKAAGAAEVVARVEACQDAFLSLPKLSANWIAGWNAAIRHTVAALAPSTPRHEEGGDRGQ